jgi:hypothetical protein
MTRTHVVIPEQLVAEIDTIVGKRALQAAAGSWKDKDHPELKQGAVKWVKKLRREYDQRLKKVVAR